MKPGVGARSSKDNGGGNSWHSGVEVANKDQDEFEAWGWGSGRQPRWRRDMGAGRSLDLILRGRGSRTGSKLPVVSGLAPAGVLGI